MSLDVALVEVTTTFEPSFDRFSSEYNILMLISHWQPEGFPPKVPTHIGRLPYIQFY